MVEFHRRALPSNARVKFGARAHEWRRRWWLTQKQINGNSKKTQCKLKNNLEQHHTKTNQQCFEALCLKNRNKNIIATFLKSNPKKSSLHVTTYNRRWWLRSVADEASLINCHVTCHPHFSTVSRSRQVKFNLVRFMWTLGRAGRRSFWQSWTIFENFGGGVPDP